MAGKLLAGRFFMLRARPAFPPVKAINGSLETRFPSRFSPPHIILSSSFCHVLD
jgi:hypothetical protein